MTKKSILKNTTSYHDRLIDSLKDQDEANTYLRVAIEEYHEDGDTNALLVALRNIAEAKGGIGRLSNTTDLNRQNLYKALSEGGNPQLDTFELILKALGYKLDIQPEDSSIFTNQASRTR